MTSRINDVFDVKIFLGCFEKGIVGEFDFDFKTAAEKFKIDRKQYRAVVIPYNEEAMKLLARQRYHPFPVFPEIADVHVNIYENEFEKFTRKELIETYRRNL